MLPKIQFSPKQNWQEAEVSPYGGAEHNTGKNTKNGFGAQRGTKK
jgi:hypothetical protein